MKHVYSFLLLLLMLSAFGTRAQILVWGKQIADSDTGHLYVHDNLTDRSGNVYIAGQFNGSIDFDPGAGVSLLVSKNINSPGAFVAKYDSSGRLLWARSIISDSVISNGAGVTAMALDNTGCVYTLGYFHTSADFDPGPGVQRKFSAYGRDMFVEKWDPSGNFSWVVTFPGTFSTTPKDLAVDAEYNVYITGTFGGTVDFDPSPSMYHLTATPTKLDAFLVKISATGQFVWGEQISGSASVYPGSICMGENENVYLTGYYYGTADFDPGSATHHLVSNGYSDIFIAKYDQGGGMVWAHSFGSQYDDRGTSLAGDATGTYITGKFGKTVDFDPGTGTQTLTAAGNNDAFILKLDKNGLYQWAYNIGGQGMDEGRSISLSGSSVNLSVSFRDMIDLDPGQGYAPAGNSDKFQFGYINLDRAGNYKWSVTEDNAVYMQGSCYMGEDDAGYIYATGRFHGTIDCDPGPAVYNLSALPNVHSYFIVKLKPATASTSVSAAMKRTGFSIYPNPAQGVIHISAEADIDRVAVSDMLGKTIYEARACGKNLSITMPVPGVYTVWLVSGETTTVEKVVVGKGQ